MHTPTHIKPLIDKYLAKTISSDELAILNEWYQSFNDTEVEISIDDDELTEELIKNRIHQKLMNEINESKEITMVKPRRIWRAVAAAAVILLGIGLYFVYTKSSLTPEQKPNELPALSKNDIAPGGNKAILVLADGSTIVLDSTSNGVISQQGNIEIIKAANGLLTYKINGKEITENDAEFYNTISTPRGGQYQVTLSDGTKVWLNAASSIRFPVVFTGGKRRVEVTGETYFEVMKDAGKPFSVHTPSSSVEVLGTQFNINAYDDEASVRTSLVEGKVTVTAKGNSVRSLKPGQQSSINKAGQIVVIDDADMEEATAWKNGRFHYNSADIKTILRQISRWYDVDIEYRGNINLHFTGQLPRSVTAVKVFEKLAMTGEVNFKIDGKKIIVTP